MEQNWLIEKVFLKAQAAITLLPLTLMRLNLIYKTIMCNYNAVTGGGCIPVRYTKLAGEAFIATNTASNLYVYVMTGRSTMKM